MKRAILLLPVFCCFISIGAFAQNPLPDLSVKELTRGKIQITWYSPERNCIQLAIQRSTDSSKNFRTIFSAQSPELMNNGYVDNKPPVGKAYYRIFYVIQGGEYFFTRAIMIETQPAPPPRALPVIEKQMVSIYVKKNLAFQLTTDEYKRFRDSITTRTRDALRRIDSYAVEWIPRPMAASQKMRIYVRDMLITELDKRAYARFKDSVRTQTKDTLFVIDAVRVQVHPYIPFTVENTFIYRNDTLLFELTPDQYRRFKDSVATRTRDTLFATDRNRIEVHPFMIRYAWQPSRYVFTNGKGYVTILLPLAARHKYHLVFFDDDGSELFRIKSIKEPELILDKTDFIHAGWFNFELYEDDKLKEKNKVFLTRE